MKLDIYDRQLIESLTKLYPAAATAEVIEELIGIGVIDKPRCKILVIREHVAALVAEGHGKVESMFMTADRFCCSYECVRNYIYYHKNVNLPITLKNAIRD